MTFDEIIDADADGSIDAGVTSHTGTAFVHPLFPGASNDPHDVAVFLLDEPVTLPVYGELPSLGLLDSIDNSQRCSQPWATARFGTSKRRGPHSLELGTRRLFAVRRRCRSTKPG